MENTFGVLLNANLRLIASCISIVRGVAEFGADADAEKMIPINLSMAGDILLYNVVVLPL
jgi:hypothetical protein